MARPSWRQHAHELAAAFHVSLCEVRDIARTPEAAVAMPGRRVVIVAPIHDESTYAVALHELGHIIAPLGALNAAAGSNLQRDEEDAAWAWAKHYALEWTPLMEQVATWARGTYDAPKPTPPARVAPIGKQIDWEDWK